MSENWERILLWMLRLSATLSFLVNTCFYCFLCCRWKLSKNIHWLLCNFSISEIIRALAVVIHGILWERLMIMHPIYYAYQEGKNSSKTSTTKLDSNFLESYSTITYTKDILRPIIDVCVSTSDIFVLLIITQFYFYLKSPWSSERLNSSNIVLVLTIWVSSIMYTVFMFIFGDAKFDEMLIVYEYCAIAEVIFNCVYFLSLIVLLFLTYRLFYYNYLELCSNVYNFNDTVMKNVYAYRQRGIRVLMSLIFLIIVPVIVTCLESFNDVIPFIKDPVIPVTMVASKSVYLFMLGSLWPFLWIHLDWGMGKELRNASKYLKLSTKLQNPLTKFSLLKESKLLTPSHNVSFFGQIQEAII